MDTATFLALALACAPQVHPDTARAIASVESSFNPYAIGVVGGALHRQPRTRAEALATIKALHADGWNYSVASDRSTSATSRGSISRPARRSIRARA
jgi:type IV secretion system protein VirB1